MAGIRKILRYDGTLSQEENARINNVSVSAINDYIRRNNIDRRYNKTATLIAECRKYFQSHPKSNKGQVAAGVSEELRRKAGKRVVKEIEESGKGKHKITCSRSFVDKYWDYISKDAVYQNYNPDKAQKRASESTEVSIPNANRKELMSEILKEIPTLFETAAAEDVSEFRRFLFGKKNLPMLFIGSGGMKANGAYSAMLYGMNSGLGRAISPYGLASLSDDVIKNSRCLLLSVGGNNDDIVYAARRCVEVNPENTACLTFYEHDKNRMLDALKGTRARIFMYQHNEWKGGFISIRMKFYFYALMYKAFAKNEEFPYNLNINLSPESCFEYRLNKEGTNLPNLKSINHFIALYGSYGEAVAYDLENVFAESGLASVQVVDYRNFCHGRFIFVGNHTENYKEPRDESDVAVVMFVSPREESIAKQLLDDVIPYKTPIVLIKTGWDSPLATLDLLVKSNVFISFVGERCYGINPNSPSNYSDIDKRFPISGVKFLAELRRWGKLTMDESEINNLREEIEAYLGQEQSNTARIEASNSHLPYPTKEDLYKEEEEDYDASQYLCYAFRRKEDLHKNVAIPLGNMCGGYPFELGGVVFPTSENAYISGLFSYNTEEHINIQKKLLEETNGLFAKRDIRHNNEESARKDWEDFNIEWMLYCIWMKAQGNKAFRKILMDIPQEATIIENSTFHKKEIPDKASFWGCRNYEMEYFEGIVDKYVEALHLEKKAEKNRLKQKYLNEYCNDGDFIGHNTMGKILMIVKKCLHDGTEPEIDYGLLESKKIHILGKRVDFINKNKPNKKIKGSLE